MSLDPIHDWWIPNIDPAEYAGDVPRREGQRGTARPGLYGEPEDPDDYDRLTARDRRDGEVKHCRACGKSEVYARGWCRNCYQKWQYQKNRKSIRDCQKKYKDRKRREAIDGGDK